MYSGSKHCISAGTTLSPHAATKAAMLCLSMRETADSLTAADSCGMDNTNSNLSGGAGFGFGGEYFRPDRLQVHQPRLRNFSLHVGLRIYPKPLRHRLRRAVADSRDLRWPAEP